MLQSEAATAGFAVKSCRVTKTTIAKNVFNAYLFTLSVPPPSESERDVDVMIRCQVSGKRNKEAET
jgi:hypothetical protein